MRRGATVLPLLAATAAAALLASCGDSGAEVSGSPAGSVEADSAVERIEAVAERFERSVAERDTEAFCEILAPSDVQRLGGGESNGQRECLAVWGPERNPLFGAKEPDFSVESLAFEGGYATAKLANGGELAFSHEGGDWYVHLAPGPVQGGKR